MINFKLSNEALQNWEQKTDTEKFEIMIDSFDLDDRYTYRHLQNVPKYQIVRHMERRFFEMIKEENFD